MTDEEIIELMAQKILCCGFHSGLNFAEEISYKTAYALAYGLLDLRDSKGERVLFTQEDVNAALNELTFKLAETARDERRKSDLIWQHQIEQAVKAERKLLADWFETQSWDTTRGAFIIPKTVLKYKMIALKEGK